MIGLGFTADHYRIIGFFNPCSHYGLGFLTDHNGIERFIINGCPSPHGNGISRACLNILPHRNRTCACGFSRTSSGIVVSI